MKWASASSLWWVDRLRLLFLLLLLFRGACSRLLLLLRSRSDWWASPCWLLLLLLRSVFVRGFNRHSPHLWLWLTWIGHWSSAFGPGLVLPLRFWYVRKDIFLMSAQPWGVFNTVCRTQRETSDSDRSLDTGYPPSNLARKTYNTSLIEHRANKQTNTHPVFLWAHNPGVGLGVKTSRPQPLSSASFHCAT